jgi:hypothetical protein
MDARALSLPVLPDAKPCPHAGNDRLPCEFLTVEEGEFTWDRTKARADFEAHLERESNRRLGRNETPLDSIWRAAEATISDIVAHVPARPVEAMIKLISMPENAAEMLTAAIDEACAAIGCTRGDFGHKRYGRRTVAYAAVALREHLPMPVVCKLLSRSDKTLWQGMKFLNQTQRARAEASGRALQPKWKKG